jgi:hypothetical protein
MDDSGKVLAKGQRFDWIQQSKLAGYKWLIDY